MKEPTFILWCFVAISIVEGVIIELLIRRIKHLTGKKNFYLKLKPHCAGYKDYIIIKATNQQEAYNLAKLYYGDEWATLFPEDKFNFDGECLNTIGE